MLLGVCYFLSLGNAISNADDSVENKTIENKELSREEGSANLSSGSIDFINSNKITHKEETVKFKEGDVVELSEKDKSIFISTNESISKDNSIIPNKKENVEETLKKDPRITNIDINGELNNENSGVGYFSD